VIPPAHGSDVTPVVRGAGEYIGSPMYEFLPEHAIAVFAIVLLPLLAFLVRSLANRGMERAVRLRARYRALVATHRLAFWLLALAGVVHLALVVSHEPSAYALGYAGLGLAELAVARRLLLGRSWRSWAAMVTGGSLLAYAVSGVAGSPPDQLGLATKLVELVTFAIVVTPVSGGRLRRLASSASVVGVTLVVAVAAWAGAFSSGDGGHHLGEYATPGTLIPAGEDRAPTPEERQVADDLYTATVAATAKYADPAVAGAVGYEVDGIFGTDFHAANPRFQHDGKVFDPTRPEQLIYAATEAGPALVGVMFEMEGIGNAGPAVGGPLTVWHAHDHICFGLAPPSLVGLTSPFGLCPLGSLTMPITNEMIHVWTMPGAPERFGHIEDAWLQDYLQGFEQNALGG